jgi:hypothetical protein
MAKTREQKRSNAKLGWILASVVAVFFAGFVARVTLFGV